MEIPLMSTLIFLTGTHLLPTATAFQCHELPPCDCRRENSWFNDKLTPYNVIDCDGAFSQLHVNFSSAGNEFIKTLNLKNSSFSRIDSRMFNGLKVGTIKIENSDAAIRHNAFHPVKETLRHLSLIHISSIAKSWKFPYLKGLDELESLELDKNGEFPLNIPRHVFRNLSLTSLKYLSMRHCEIAIVAESAMDGLPNLETLDLSYNKLPYIPTAIIWLKNLKHFIMTHNEPLTYIHSEAFISLNNLREIDLGHSKISTIQEDAFIGLENSLEDLKLNHGSLQNGHFASMKDLKKLKRLDLSYNRIIEMSNSSFIGFPPLEYLDISGQADDVDRLVLVDATFRGIERSLRTLKLRDSGMVDSLPLAPLSVLSRLLLLDLSNNDFEEIPESFFDGIRSKTILMTDMEITDVSSTAFDALMPNVEIIFDRNNITNISFILDTKLCAFSKLSFLENPISCDCDVVEIAATNRVQNLIGKCADKFYRGEDLRRIHEMDIVKTTCGEKTYNKITHCHRLNSAIRIAGSCVLYMLSVFLIVVSSS